MVFRHQNNDSILHKNLLSYKQIPELVNFAVKMDKYWSNESSLGLPLDTLPLLNNSKKLQMFEDPGTTLLGVKGSLNSKLLKDS